MKFSNSVLPESLVKFLQGKCGRDRECKGKLLIEMFNKVNIDEQKLIECRTNERLFQGFYIPIEIKVRIYDIQLKILWKYDKRIPQKQIFTYIFQEYLAQHNDTNS